MADHFDRRFNTKDTEDPKRKPIQSFFTSVSIVSIVLLRRSDQLAVRFRTTPATGVPTIRNSRS
jgi:hypothetical protein